MTDEPSRRESARAKAAALRQAQLARERRRRSLLVTLAVVVVLAVVVGVGAVVQAHRSSSSAGSATPAHLVGGTGIVLGDPSATVTVTTYEDFQCPICKQFQATTGPTLDQLRQAGTVKVVFKPVAILDHASTTDYSTRALSAAGCVVDAKPEAFPALEAALFAAQPAEGSAGLTDARLTQIAQQAGAGDLSTCIDAHTYAGWASRVTDQASKDGLQGTPWVLVDGTPLTDPTPQALEQAVQAARQKG